jgi:hypothetical protein
VNGATPTPPLLGWVSTLDAPDRQSFYDDLAAAVAAARDGDDPAEVERCLRQWRLTAEGMANAELRDQLLES